MNHEYKGYETPEERLRNKLSVIFVTIQVAERGNCDMDMIKKSVEVMPQIVEHLEDIEEFYRNKYEPKQN